MRAFCEQVMDKFVTMPITDVIAADVFFSLQLLLYVYTTVEMIQCDKPDTCSTYVMRFMERTINASYFAAMLLHA
jgi:hypothetical protein